MKIKNQNFIMMRVMIIIFLIISSCNEDFLEPIPLSFYAPENVLVSENGLQSLLDNALSTLRFEFCTDNSPFMTTLKYSDVTVEGQTSKAECWQDLNIQMIPSGDHYSNPTTKIGWYWDESYKIIKDCNTIIDRIDAAEFSSESRKNTLLGSAYFLRAFRYYAKTLLYGDVPFVIEEIKSPRLDFYTTTKESIWKKMIDDLEFAVQHVPEANNVARGQVTKAACKHLLAKYYLLEGRFDDAIQQTSDIINGGIHRLVTERFGVDRNIPNKDVIWDLHRPLNKSINAEGLLITVDRLDMEGNTSGTAWMRNVVPWWEGNILTPDGASGMSNRAGLEIPLVEKYGRGIARLRPTGYTMRDIWNLNGETDWSDFRHNKENGNWMTMEMMVYNNPALKGKNEWYGKNLRLFNDNGQVLSLDTIRSWHQWPFYKVSIPDQRNVQPQGGPSDWYIFRLAETYLLRAEAYVWKNEWQKAADDINKIRERANAQYMYNAADISQQQIKAVLDERNRELFLEEMRKIELTRISIIYARTNIPCFNGKIYNMTNISEDNFYYDWINEVSDFYNKENVQTLAGNKFTISPHHIFWPIHEDAIKVNVDGVINQNKGYFGYENNVPPLVYVEN